MLDAPESRRRCGRHLSRALRPTASLRLPRSSPPGQRNPEPSSGGTEAGLRKLVKKQGLLFENRPGICNYKENKKNNTRMLDTLFIEDFIDSMEEYFHF